MEYRYLESDLTPKSPLFFLLPEDNRSGGVRVTVEMANQLVDRGYPVSILTPPRKTIRSNVAQQFRNLKKNNSWLADFKGNVHKSVNMEKFAYPENSTVIAVGSFTVGHLRGIPQNVLKIRYNHGMPLTDFDLKRFAWTGDEPIFTVSKTLVDELRQLSDTNFIRVVPNGVSTSEYFDTGSEKNGIGIIYGEHPAKAPEFTVELTQQIKSRFPNIPIRVVSTLNKPPHLVCDEYFKRPSIEQIREIYSSSKVWLLPSDSEGLPGPVLESMSCGAINISTDNAGGMEIIESGKNGWLVPRRDSEAFIQRIEQVFFRNSYEDNERMVKRGYETALSFSWENAANAFELALSEARTLYLNSQAKNTSKISRPLNSVRA